MQRRVQRRPAHCDAVCSIRAQLVFGQRKVDVRNHEVLAVVWRLGHNASIGGHDLCFTAAVKRRFRNLQHRRHH